MKLNNKYEAKWHHLGNMKHYQKLYSIDTTSALKLYVSDLHEIVLK